MELGQELSKPGPRRKSSSTVNLPEMDRLHRAMVRSLEEAEGEQLQPPGRKTSVSTACQTDKVSRKVSHVVRRVSQAPAISSIVTRDTEVTSHDKMVTSHDLEMTPVTRCLSRPEAEAGGVARLRECNNLLVSFIERARVLAEAGEVTASLPGSLAQRTQAQLDTQQLGLVLAEEVARLRARLAAREEERRVRGAELRMLQEQKVELELGLERSAAEVASLDTRLLQLEQGGGGGGDTLGRVQPLQEAALPDLPSLMLDQSRTEERRQLEVRVRTEFLQQMKAALERVRGQLAGEYSAFIARVQRESQELLASIEAVTAARVDRTAAADYHAALRELEAARNSEARIRGLEEDVAAIAARLAARADTGRDRRQLEAAVEAELEQARAALARLLAEVTERARASCEADSEVSLYTRLLDFEEERAAAGTQKRSVTVRSSVVSASKQQPSSSSESEDEARPRRESGYRSDAETLYPADRFLDTIRGEM